MQLLAGWLGLRKQVHEMAYAPTLTAQRKAWEGMWVVRLLHAAPAWLLGVIAGGWVDGWVGGGGKGSGHRGWGHGSVGRGRVAAVRPAGLPWWLWLLQPLMLFPSALLMPATPPRRHGCRLADPRLGYACKASARAALPCCHPQSFRPPPTPPSLHPTPHPAPAPPRLQTWRRCCSSTASPCGSGRGCHSSNTCSSARTACT